MDSFYYYSSSSSTFPSTTFTITNEEFNLFHTIDRKLYSRLIFEIGRDPAESIQVMAFWLWLERAGYEPRIVNKMLSLSPILVNELVDETITCLKCIESDVFSFDRTEISTLQNLIRGDISLRFLHDNRITVLRRVTMIANEVCARAFEDILRQIFGHVYNYSLWNVSNQSLGSGMPSNGNVGESSSSVKTGQKLAMAGGGFYNPYMNVPYYTSVGKVSTYGEGFSRHRVGVGNVQSYDPNDLRTQQPVLNNELSEMLVRVNLTIAEEEKEIPQDERTIFLTFSKGYPISENEVKEFFTRKFGDFIEAIYMQEVPADEQVLYARIIARSSSVIDRIVGRRGKAKFSINGKHVWTRKYVKHQPKSPPQPVISSQSVQPTLPPAPEH